eukprot:GHVU01049403.1.p3 GENE.GHVU01049403.1~~GHVU01049403.1.p3  ORF type:complete len:117 (+),score=29.43 GHVU01049403.1:37-351(+)
MEAPLAKKREALLPKKMEAPLAKKREALLPKKMEAPLAKKREASLPEEGDASFATHDFEYPPRLNPNSHLLPHSSVVPGVGECEETPSTAFALSYGSYGPMPGF